MARERAHGKRSTYEKGCRCQPCKDASSAYVKERRKRVRRGEILLVDDPRHGTKTGWNYGCRCEPCRAGKRDFDLEDLYGLGPGEWSVMASRQKHRCALCKVARIDRSSPIDHSHVTGATRGILCRDCNLLLGYAKDSVDRLTEAMLYLAEHHAGDPMFDLMKGSIR